MGYPVALHLSPYPGLWPSTLTGFADRGLVPDCTCERAPLDDYQRQPWGLDYESFGPPAIILAQQLLIELLVAYFAAAAQAVAGGGRAQDGLPSWSGALRPASWRPPSGGGATGASAGGHSGHAESGSATDGPRSQGQRGIPDGLRTNAANGARVVRELGFDGSIGGLGHRSGPSDHPHGNAIDVMTHGDTAMGNRVAEHFRENHAQLGVKYVIYRQRIASPRTGWQWRPMADRGNPTANHMDHPHISFT